MGLIFFTLKNHQNIETTVKLFGGNWVIPFIRGPTYDILAHFGPIK
jgi:hypothetical protein